MKLMDRKYIFPTIAIASMWLAVLFVGIFAPSLEVRQPTNHVDLPVVAIIPCIFAAIATIFVASWGYRGQTMR